jgi:L-threonylcarbamoyladenylate synthase
METKRLNPTKENIQYAAQVIRQGGLVAFPTETVYGLGADGLSAQAVAKIYEAKGRPSDNPMILHIASPLDLEKLAMEITPVMEALIQMFWPGPLTLVVKKRELVPLEATGGLDTVAVRMPNHEVALSLIQEAGCPIAAPSANLSGKPSPTRAEDVWEDLSGKIQVLLEGEDCKVGIESTVLDVTASGVVTVLRPGIITVKDIQDVLKVFGLKKIRVHWGEEMSPEETPRAPGMKYRHYAPQAEMIILEGNREAVQKTMERIRAEKEQEQKEDGQAKKVGILFFHQVDSKEVAHDFFSRLRDLDRQGVDLILAAALDSDDGVAYAVMNRMLKSAGYKVIKVGNQ